MSLACLPVRGSMRPPAHGMIEDKKKEPIRIIKNNIKQINIFNFVGLKFISAVIIISLNKFNENLSIFD